MLHIHEGFRPSKNMEMDEKCNLEKEGNIILMNIDMTRGQRSLCNLKNSLFPKEKTTPNALDLRLYCHLIRTFQKLEGATFSHSSLFLPHCLSRPSLSKTNMNLPKQ